MLDISMAGATVSISGADGTSINNINEFTDEGNPIEIPDMDIADGNMNLNGVLVTWTKAQAAEFSFSLIPNSPSDRALSSFLARHAIGGKGAIPEAFISTLVLNIPANINQSATGSKGFKSFVFSNGRMRRGSPGLGSNAEGKMSARTFNFIFERVDQA